MTAMLTLAFFLSGAAALIFEIVWVHRFGLVFGESVGATSIVLSSFMGGMALGTALVGYSGRRIGNLLRAYAVLEFTVAVTGLGLTYLLPTLPALTAPITTAAGGHSWIVDMVRFVASFAALLLPTTAMGATLPVVVGSQSRGQHTFGQALGRLYGWNTLGAVGGALMAELLLVDRVGISGSAWVASLFSLVAASLAFTLTTRRFELEPDGRDAGLGITKPQPPLSGQGDAWHRSTLLIGAGLAGGALLALEMVWFRFLSMYVLTTTLTMSVLLAVVLAGIGLGGLAASRWETRGAQCAPIAFLAGCSTALSYLAFQWLTHGAQIAAWYSVAWLACALTGATSFLSGVLFTTFGQALRDLSATSDDRDGVRAAAWLTLVNTAGAMCGAPIAAFLLLPWLGMERTIVAIAALYGAIGALATTFKTSTHRTRRMAWLVTGIALVLTLIGFPFGLMAGTYFPRVAAAYAGDGSTIVATREGPSETIFLMQQQWLGQPVYNRIVTNGFSMTGTSVPALRYMRYFAYWPMLLHEGPVRRALVICYGAGVTAGAALDLPAVETVDIVELSPDIVAMSDRMYAPDRHPLHDPRARLHIEDGRIFLQTSRDRFDLITGEPPPPRTPGAANIYTREYFQLMYDRLQEGGMATYWVPVARPDPGTDVNTILRAFCEVFIECSLWNATPFDLMLIGTRHPVGPVSQATFTAAWSAPTLATKLREIGLEEPEQIGATFVGDAAFLRQLVRDAPPLVDDFPQRLRPVVLRPSLSDPRYPFDPAVVEMYRRTLDPVRAHDAFAASDFIKRLWPGSLVDGTLHRFDEQRMMNRVLWEGGRPLMQIEDLHNLLTTTSLKTLPLWFLGSDDVKQRIAEASADRTGATEYARALRALVARDYHRAAAYFGESERVGLRAETVRPLQVYSLCLAGDLDTARLLARGVEARSDAERHFWQWLRTTYGVENGPSL
jgi:predicted membrane-bound spermidine synthase